MADLAALLRGFDRIGFDTSVFIYLIEGSGRFAEPAGVALDELAVGTFAGVTSVLTVMEIAVKPLQVGRPEVAEEYDVLVSNYPNLELAVIDRSVAWRAAALRAKYRLRPADALDVAACLEHRAAAFLTNDADLRRVTELHVLILEDFAAQ